MPKLVKKSIVGFDSETTGLDLYHIARPFFFTITDDIQPTYWEWDVNPLTRMPRVIEEDLREIERKLDGADEIVGQNIKFDIQGSATVGLEWKDEWYEKTHDTLLAGHLIATAEPHYLDTLSIRYLRFDIRPFEEVMKEACKEARSIARRDYPKWLIAKEGLPGMPSVGGGSSKTDDEKPWKNDMWLPRTLAKIKKLPKGIKGLANIHRKEPFDVYIGRPKGNDLWKFGNPFQIGADGDRATVINKFRSWLLDGNYFNNKDASVSRRVWILNNIKTLEGKVLGCFCTPEACHGEVYQEFLPAHPWWTVTSDYSNVDSSVVRPIWEVQKQILHDRGLWNVYLERRKLIRIIVDMERQGVTYSQDRLKILKTRFEKESAEIEKELMKLGDGKLTSLPKSGTTKEMRSLLFDVWKIPVVKTAKTGPSLDKGAIAIYEATLPEESNAYKFITLLKTKRKRDTSISYMTSYEEYACPTTFAGIKTLHSSLNPTGQVTLRWSSKNPNEQNISKEGYEGEKSVRYCFGPAPNREWWSLDYKNIELRIPAYIAPEPAMIELFERPNDPPFYGSNHLLAFSILHPKEWAEHGAKVKDVYADTLYQWTKNGNFAVQYGAMEESGTADRAYHVDGGQKLIKAKFKNIALLNDRMIEIAKKQGYVETVYDKDVGGSYPIQTPKTQGKHGQMYLSPTIPLNYYIQSTAMWCTGKAMRRVYEYLRTLRGNCRMTMQVHDEIVIDLPKGKTPRANLSIVKEVARLMSLSGEDIGVPLGVDYNYHPESWGDKVKVV